MRQKKFILQEQDIPTQWYNIQADMPNKPMPPLNPQTHKPLSADDLSHPEPSRFTLIYMSVSLVERIQRLAVCGIEFQKLKRHAANPHAALLIQRALGDLTD